MLSIEEYFKSNEKAINFKTYREGRNISLKKKFKIFIDALIELPFEIIVNFPGSIGIGLRSLTFPFRLKACGVRNIFSENLVINGFRNISIGSYTWIDKSVNISASFGEVSIGDRIHIAPYSILNGGGGLYIEDYVGIASFVQIYSHSEVPLRGKRMSGPMISEDEKGFRSAPVYLRKDSFIGAGSIILPGITIGEGSIISANSVVTKSTDPWFIYSGNPAVKIGRRRR